MKKIDIYDTTLRDGSQAEGISYSVQDKLLIAQKLDEMGLAFIEGGWPGANPKDVEFFEEAKKIKFKHAKLAAFGSTRKPGAKASEDEVLKGLLAAETQVITLFGKSWDLHVREVLKVELDENLRMIADSVAYLRSKGREVVYDAEHFFDGHKANPEYALKTITAARDAGASVIVLCDTNGGNLPSHVYKVVSEVVQKLKHPIGCHVHNDGGLGVANTLAAVEAGAVHVQGVVNGFGERCGNADLIPIIANCELKLGLKCLPEGKLKELSELSRFINEISNRPQAKGEPYVGMSAFAHKGGIHINAVMKNPVTYEHIDPALVGNRRRFLVSEVGGRTNIQLKAEEIGVDLKRESPEARKILEEVQRLEHEGYVYEGAEASFELLVHRITGKHKPAFEVKDAQVSNERIGAENPNVNASVTIRVDGRDKTAEKTGDGPVDALGQALRAALAEFYPEILEISLDDYKVRIVNSKAGIAARVRVVIEFRDKNRVWATVGVSTNIIEASWKALTDAYDYKLLKSK